MFQLKKNSSVEQFSEKIEQAVQDDLAMFLEFGEEYFTLEELENLHALWEKEYQLTEKLRGRFVLLCTSSFMLIPLSGLIAISGYSIYLPIFIICFPVIFLVGLAGFLVLYFKFGKVTSQENVGRRLKFAIRNKLQRRGFSKGFEI
ncbi:MAG: hypothetical protein ACJAT4_001571 [Granulosicoccus sp.]|jgi:hypothetical protein